MLMHHHFECRPSLPSRAPVKRRLRWVFAATAVFCELCRNKRKCVSEGSAGVGTTPRCNYHLLVLPPTEWGESRLFSAAVITFAADSLPAFPWNLSHGLFIIFSPCSFLPPGPRNRLFSPTWWMRKPLTGGKNEHSFTSFLLLTW